MYHGFTDSVIHIGVSLSSLNTRLSYIAGVVLDSGGGALYCISNTRTRMHTHAQHCMHTHKTKQMHACTIYTCIVVM